MIHKIATIAARSNGRLLGQDQPPLAPAAGKAVDSPEPRSLQSVATTLVPDADDAIMSAALVFFAGQTERADVASAPPDCQP